MSATHPQSQLSFSPALFQKIDAPLFLFRHLTSPTSARPSSRSPTTFRPPVINTSPLSHAHGSAVVRSGDTAVVCGVRAELLPLAHQGESKIVLRHNSKLNQATDDFAADIEIVKGNSLVVPNLELGTGCNPKFTPGPPSDYAQAVAERWRSWLVDVLAIVPSSTLEIRGEGPDGEEEVKAYWVLYVDVTCISLDGGLLETGWAAIVAALRATWLPVVRWDKEAGDMAFEAARRRPLELRQLGYCASFAVFRSKEEAEGDDVEMEGDRQGAERLWVISDPDDFEEGVCEEKVVVLRRGNGTLAKIEMGGGGGGEEVVMECLERSKARCEEWRSAVEGKMDM